MTDIGYELGPNRLENLKDRNFSPRYVKQKIYFGTKSCILEFYKRNILCVVFLIFLTDFSAIFSRDIVIEQNFYSNIH